MHNNQKMNELPNGPEKIDHPKESWGPLYPPEELSNIKIIHEIQNQPEINNTTGNNYIGFANNFLRSIKNLVRNPDMFYRSIFVLEDYQKGLTLVIDSIRLSPEIEKELIKFRNKVREWLDILKTENTTNLKGDPTGQHYLHENYQLWKAILRLSCTVESIVTRHI